MCYNDIMLIKKMPPGMLRRIVDQVLLDRPPNSPLSPWVCCSVSTESPGSQRSDTATSQPGGALEALSQSVGRRTVFNWLRQREHVRSFYKTTLHIHKPHLWSSVQDSDDPGSGKWLFLSRVAPLVGQRNILTVISCLINQASQATTLSQTDRSNTFTMYYLIREFHAITVSYPSVFFMGVTIVYKVYKMAADTGIWCGLVSSVER